MSTWNDDDRAFFDKALLLMAPLVYQREKSGTTDFLMQHASMAAESLTNARKERLEAYAEPLEITHKKREYSRSITERGGHAPAPAPPP